MKVLGWLASMSIAALFFSWVFLGEKHPGDDIPFILSFICTVLFGLMFLMASIIELDPDSELNRLRRVVPNDQSQGYFVSKNIYILLADSKNLDRTTKTVSLILAEDSKRGHETVYSYSDDFSGGYESIGRVLDQLFDPNEWRVRIIPSFDMNDRFPYLATYLKRYSNNSADRWISRHPNLL